MRARRVVRNDDFQLKLFGARLPTCDSIEAIPTDGREALAGVPAEDGCATRSGGPLAKCGPHMKHPLTDASAEQASARSLCLPAGVFRRGMDSDARPASSPSGLSLCESLLGLSPRPSESRAVTGVEAEVELIFPASELGKIAQAPQGDVLASAHDDVVANVDLEQLTGADEVAGDADVGIGGTGLP